MVLSRWTVARVTEPNKMENGELAEGVDIVKDPEPELEPSVESDSREERIAARRIRILNRIEAERRAALGEPTEDDSQKTDPEQERRSKKQFEESSKRLGKLLADGTQLVTNVKVAGDAREVQRRQEAAEARKGRIEKVETDVTTSEERFEEIARKWKPALGKTIPQELHDKLVEQKSACDAMIEEKEKLINELQQELKDQDDHYVQDLKKQAEDIDLLLERMEEQMKTLAKAHKEELKEIEYSFVTERRELLEQNRGEWEAAVGERRQEEVERIKRNEQMVENNEATLREMRIKHAEEFNHIKIKLETDIQNLQQQIQQMKATFQLNAEKLEYNLHVLKKRDEENTLTISQQKRKITRLQDVLTGLRRRQSAQEKQLHESLSALTEDYRKSVEQFTELQKKCKHFMACDRKRFIDIWQMNDDEVQELAEKVLKADEIIQTQQLGRKREHPPLVDSPLTHHLATEQAGVSKALHYAASIVSATASGVPSSASMPSKAHSKGPVRTPAVIKASLDLLAEESGFLVESKLYTLLAPLDEDERLLMKLDAIFKALKVEKEADIHLLVEHFIAEEKGGSGREDEVTPQTDEQLDEERVSPRETPQHESQSEAAVMKVDGVRLIHPNEVAKVLRQFIEERQLLSGRRAPSQVLLKASSRVAVDDSDLLDGAYWNAMAAALDKDDVQVWSTLHDALEKYHSSLVARSSLIDESDSLRQQNTELRFLLQQYMQSRINDELIIPPTQLMAVGPPGTPPPTGILNR